MSEDETPTVLVPLGVDMFGQLDDYLAVPTSTADVWDESRWFASPAALAQAQADPAPPDE